MTAALEISSDFLNLLVLRKKKEGIFQVAKIKLDLPSGTIEEGKIADQKIFLQKLKELAVQISKNKLKISEIMVLIPDDQVFAEVRFFPATSDSEISQAIQLNANSIFPQDISKIYLDWQEFPGAQSPTSERAILVAACPKEVVDSYLKNLKLAGFLTFALEGSIFATCRTIGERVSIVLQVSGKSLTLGLCYAGLPYFFKTVDSEILKKDILLLKEIEKLLDFAQSSKMKDQVSQIIICGEGNLESIQSKIAQKIKIETLVFKDFSKVRNPDLESSEVPLLGLALRTLIDPKSDFNLSLLPIGTFESNQITKAQLFLGTLRTAFLTSSLSLLLIFILFWTFLSYLSRNLTTQLQAVSNIPISTKTIELQNKVASFNQQVALLRQLEQQNSYPSFVFQAVSEAIPDGLSISQITYTAEKEISLSGVADNQTTLLAFKGNLEKSPVFQNIQIPTSTVAPDQKVSFGLKLPLEGSALKKKASE